MSLQWLLVVSIPQARSLAVPGLRPVSGAVARSQGGAIVTAQRDLPGRMETLGASRGIPGETPGTKPAPRGAVSERRLVPVSLVTLVRPVNPCPRLQALRTAGPSREMS